MGLLKRRKNKQFDYNPRYFDNGGEGNPYKIKHKFDEFRSTIGEGAGLKSKFTNAMNDLKGDQSKKTNKTIIIIIAVLVLFFLIFIDFDLSIFRIKN
jgi:hypothetical protein